MSVRLSVDSGIRLITRSLSQAMYHRYSGTVFFSHTRKHVRILIDVALDGVTGCGGLPDLQSLGWAKPVADSLELQRLTAVVEEDEGCLPLWTYGTLV